MPKEWLQQQESRMWCVAPVGFFLMKWFWSSFCTFSFHPRLHSLHFELCADYSMKNEAAAQWCCTVWPYGLHVYINVPALDSWEYKTEPSSEHYLDIPLKIIKGPCRRVTIRVTMVCVYRTFKVRMSLFAPAFARTPWTSPKLFTCEMFDPSGWLMILQFIC